MRLEDASVQRAVGKGSLEDWGEIGGCVVMPRSDEGGVKGYALLRCKVL